EPPVQGGEQASPEEEEPLADRFPTVYSLHVTAGSALDYTESCVQHSHRRAAGVCAGGAWLEQSSRGGSGDCPVDKLTPGLRRPW
uniref:Uncharacterized protein n=1 Tax=Oryzias latipes TaxID=8090 RepID=A0A3B3H9W9_ORYLA